MTELKPCPFCGGEAVRTPEMPRARCPQCHAVGPHIQAYGDSYADAWNRRADTLLGRGWQVAEALRQQLRAAHEEQWRLMEALSKRAEEGAKATRDVAGVREQRDAFERRCEELLARATKAERDLAEAEQRETSALGCGFEVLQKLLNERALRASAQDRAFEAEYWSHDRARKAEAERDDLARKLAEALHGPTPGMRAPPVLAVAIEPEAWRVD